MYKLCKKFVSEYLLGLTKIFPYWAGVISRRESRRPDNNIFLFRRGGGRLLCENSAPFFFSVIAQISLLKLEDFFGKLAFGGEAFPPVLESVAAGTYA